MKQSPLQMNHLICTLKPVPLNLKSPHPVTHFLEGAFCRTAQPKFPQF